MPTREELFLVYPSGQYPFTVEQIRALARVRRELTVAMRDDAVVAFANLYDVNPGRRAFIGNVIVTAACRGAGLGRRLVAHMTRLGFEKYDVAQMAIAVFSHNTQALLLYGGLGFRPCAVEERRRPGGGRCALIHMVMAKADYAGAASLPADTPPSAGRMRFTKRPNGGKVGADLSAPRGRGSECIRSGLHRGEE